MLQNVLVFSEFLADEHFHVMNIEVVAVSDCTHTIERPVADEELWTESVV